MIQGGTYLIVVREDVRDSVEKPSNLLRVPSSQPIHRLDLTLARLLHLPTNEIDALASLTRRYKPNITKE